LLAIKWDDSRSLAGARRMPLACCFTRLPAVRLTGSVGLLWLYLFLQHCCVRLLYINCFHSARGYGILVLHRREMRDKGRILVCQPKIFFTKQ
jgi:hypothetical protein